MIRQSLVLLLVLFVPSVSAQVSSTSGSQSQSTVGVNAAPNQQLIVNSAPIPSSTTTTVRSTPSIYPPSMQPTTPCTAIISGGLSLVGVGVSIGGSYEDKECTRREFARVLAQMGFPDAGLAVLCLNAEVSLAAPQLCKRSAYVAERSGDAVSSEKPVMPPAPVIPRVAPPAPVPTEPIMGAVGYSVSGATMRYNGRGEWISEEHYRRQQAAAAARATGEAAITAPLLTQPPVNPMEQPR